MPQRIDEIAPGLRNTNQPLEGVATAGQPEEGHFGRLASAGYRAVIHLRGPGEDRGLDEPEAIRRAGMEYANLPVGYEDVDDETFERFRELMAEPERRPVLVHCASANRVGALLIPYLILDEGMTAEEASRAASRVGLRNGKLRRAALRYAARAGPPAPPSRPRGVGEAPTHICNRHPTTREDMTVHSIHVMDLPWPKAVGYSAQSRLGRVLRRSRSNSGIDPSRRSDSHGRTLYEPVCALLLK